MSEFAKMTADQRAAQDDAVVAIVSVGLRQYYAGHALIGIMQRRGYSGPAAAAEEAFAVADAMIRVEASQSAPAPKPNQPEPKRGPGGRFLRKDKADEGDA